MPRGTAKAGVGVVILAVLVVPAVYRGRGGCKTTRTPREVLTLIGTRRGRGMVEAAALRPGLRGRRQRGRPRQGWRTVQRPFRIMQRQHFLRRGVFDASRMCG